MKRFASSKFAKFSVIAVIAILAFALLTVAAQARLGGGEAFGGGDFGTSSGSGVDSDVIDILNLVLFLIELCIDAPIIGIPLVIIIVLFFLFSAFSKSSNAGVSSSTFSGGRKIPNKEKVSSVVYENTEEKVITNIQNADPNFSLPLFLDFATMLYTKFQAGRTTGMKNISCYIAPDLRERICKDTKAAFITEVSNIIVGSVTPEKFAIGNGLQKLVVKMETNYTEKTSTGERTTYSKEKWVFARKDKVLSQGPDKITKFNCPHCGSGSELDAESKCRYCGELILDGSYAWVLVNILVTSRNPRPNLHLSLDGTERGTELPTIVHSKLNSALRAMSIKHPDFSWQQLEAKFHRYFLDLQKAWNDGSLEKVRHFETDHLYATHNYQLQSYKSQGFKNHVERVHVEKMMPVKLVSDAFYDSITVRIWAECLDWTEYAHTGKVVSGSKDRSRFFTEYWTFIRRSDYSPENKHSTGCPNCGASLESINMAGVCQYCDTKITTGNFDWVLSRIDQDQVYMG